MATDIAPRLDAPAPGVDSSEYLNANVLPPQVPDGPPFSDPSPFRLTHDDGPPYKEDLIDTEYVLETGVDVCAVLGNPASTSTPTNVKVRYGYPTMLKIVKWTIERTNAKAILPHYDTQDPNEVLVKATIYPAMPLIGIGKVTYRISGLYVYKLLVAKTLERGSTYPAGASAAETRESKDNYYDYRDFDKSLLDSRFALESAARAPSRTPTPLEQPLNLEQVIPNDGYRTGA